jgi:NAD(P)-dependent dehydrogenase (short-subunit alcohol dehydrogenase family)
MPVGRLGRHADIALLCLYLASDEARRIAGQTLQRDGGSITA